MSPLGPISHQPCAPCLVWQVWRGIKDATLPQEFWVPNAMGVRGGIEYAFSSTTVDKQQAMLYAQGHGHKEGDASVCPNDDRAVI